MQNIVFEVQIVYDIQLSVIISVINIINIHILQFKKLDSCFMSITSISSFTSIFRTE